VLNQTKTHHVHPRASIQLRDSWQYVRHNGWPFSCGACAACGACDAFHVFYDAFYDA